MRQHLSGKDVMRELVSLCKPILGIIEGSRVTQQPDLQGRVIEFLASDDADVPVQVPIGVLRSAREHHPPSTLKSWGLGPVHAHCSQVITARLSGPARAKNDWSIQTRIRCACSLCETLTQYLRAKDKVRFKWPLVKDQRFHIHRTIDSFDFPITHTTRRKGRPFMLVLEKTAELFERDAAERLSWQQELQWLNKTHANF
jgi:hypothetical protein